MKDRFWERGGQWVVGQIVLLLGVVCLSVVYHAHWHHWGLLISGWLFLVIGAALGLAGAAALRGNLSPFPKPQPQGQLIRHGIYARIRHPLYTSVMAAALGWTLVCQSWPAFFVAVALIPFFHAKARQEEYYLAQKFVEYAEYARTTRRFIPWIY